MYGVLLQGVIFGIGAALAVGPIFVTIIHEAATRGFMASFRVILGSATADLLLLLPALGMSWLIATVNSAAFWVGVFGTLFFIHLGITAGCDAWRLWRGSKLTHQPSGWSFSKGLLGNLLNPLTWLFWLGTGTPTMLQAYTEASWAGLGVFTITWFLVASGLEALIALAVVRSQQVVGVRGMAIFNGCAAMMFILLACELVVRMVG